MGGTLQAFYLVVQRQLIEQEKPGPQPDLLPNLFLDQDNESIQKGKYGYRALVTNLDLQANWDEHKVVHFYNQRGEAWRTGSRNCAVISAAQSCSVAILLSMRRISSCVP